MPLQILSKKQHEEERMNKIQIFERGSMLNLVDTKFGDNLTQPLSDSTSLRWLGKYKENESAALSVNVMSLRTS